jgi:hypothetical protein
LQTRPEQHSDDDEHEVPLEPQEPAAQKPPWHV